MPNIVGMVNMTFGRLGAGLLGIALIAAAVAAAGTLGDASEREITIVARDMTYYVDGRPEPNPTLRFKAGERVRLRLRNDDIGYEHNVEIPSLGIRSRLIEHGETDEIRIRVPAQAATSAYKCGPHGEMMRGNIAIE